MKSIKINTLLIIDAIRASFIALVPFYILYSFVILSIEILKYFHLFNTFFTLDDAHHILDLLTILLPIVFNLTISYHLASAYYTAVNRFLTVILSLTIYLSVGVISNQVDVKSDMVPQSYVMAIFIPLLATYMLARIIQSLKHYQNNLNKKLSKNITTMIIYAIPFSLVFFVVTFIFSTLSIYLNMGSGVVLFDETQGGLLLFVRTVIANFLWFFGIHGINLFNSIVDVTILYNFMQENLTYMDFFNHFVLLGGLGSGLSLVIAIFIASKDKHTSFIGKMAAPFVLFNINEILIFGIPIVMNFSLIVPFILTPTLNFILSYTLLSYTDLITFADTSVPWTTPALINIYLATDGNLIAVLFQLSLIIIGTLIYIPYIKKYTKTQSSTITLENMAKKFDINLSMEAKQDIKFHEAQSSLIKSHHKINDIVEMINHNNLILYYQPKINVQKNSCNDFEALLRIKKPDGSVGGPDFMIDIENSGMASILDVWVCKEIKKDLALWSQNGFYPNISINLFPHTLEDRSYVNDIINIVKGDKVNFEILERRSSLNEKISQNGKLLKENGFEISLDDLGVGYTNFSVLYELPLDVVKIDKKIIEYTSTEKGFVLYKNICQLCANLNLQIVLEGVETKEEYDRVMNKDIGFIQGWYFSKALPFKEVKSYSENFRNS